MHDYSDKIKKAETDALAGYGWEDIEARHKIVPQHARKLVKLAAECRRKQRRGANVG